MHNAQAKGRKITFDCTAGPASGYRRSVQICKSRNRRDNGEESRRGVYPFLSRKWIC